MTVRQKLRHRNTPLPTTPKLPPRNMRPPLPPAPPVQSRPRHHARPSTPPGTDVGAARARRRLTRPACGMSPGQPHKESNPRTPPRRSGVLFFVCRIRATTDGFCAVNSPLPCHIVPALCQKPPPYAISRKIGFQWRNRFLPPRRNPGFSMGFYAYFEQNRSNLHLSHGKPSIYAPPAGKVAVRLSRWFHGVLPGGF